MNVRTKSHHRQKESARQAARHNYDSTDLYDELRKFAPKGHPEFAAVVLEALKTHSDKNHDYTLGGPVVGNFARVAKILSLYPTFPWPTKEGVLCTYTLKQFDTLLHSLGRQHLLHTESLTERVMDIMVYMGILVCMLRERG